MKTGYRPKIIKCRLHMGGKTIAQIREQYTGQGMTYRGFESIQKANEYFDGMELLLSLWDYDHQGMYHLHDWEKAQDERLMMATYYAEQVHPEPRYIDALDRFVEDWKSGKYDPGCPMVFDPEDVEEIEVVSEEVLPADDHRAGSRDTAPECHQRKKAGKKRRR